MVRWPRAPVLICKATFRKGWREDRVHQTFEEVGELKTKIRFCRVFPDRGARFKKLRRLTPGQLRRLRAKGFSQIRTTGLRPAGKRLWEAARLVPVGDTRIQCARCSGPASAALDRETGDLYPTHFRSAKKVYCCCFCTFYSGATAVLPGSASHTVSCPCRSALTPPSEGLIPISFCARSHEAVATALLGLHSLPITTSSNSAATSDPTRWSRPAWPVG